MYAIIKLAGHQYRVEKDMVFFSELTGNEEGSEFTTSDVMVVGSGADTKVGKPFVSGAGVKLQVVETFKADKIHGFIYKKRTGYRKKWGHRQNLQKLKVLEISA